MARDTIATVCVLLHICYHVSGYVDYIPPSEPLCDELIPPVRQRKRQEDINYFYQISSWESDHVLRIILLGTKRFRMKGFLIQVRKNNTVYGEFRPKHGAIRIDCPPGRKNTIYYIQANYTTRLHCNWIAPVGFDHHKDTVYIFATTMKKLSKYWLSVERNVPRFPILPPIPVGIYDSDRGTSEPLCPGEFAF